MVATSKNRQDLVNILVTHGADLNLRNAVRVVTVCKQHQLFSKCLRLGWTIRAMDFHSEERYGRYVWLIVRENDGISWRRNEGKLNL